MLNTRSSTVVLPPCPLQSSWRSEAIWDSLRHLDAVYPDFRGWFWGKVVPGVETGDRRVFTHAGQAGIDGAVIAKSDGRERKLCTIWVAPAARGRGIASDLVDEALDWLGDPQPLLTVPEERLEELTPLARARGFTLIEGIGSLYRPGRIEYVFNGRLLPRLDG